MTKLFKITAALYLGYCSYQYYNKTAPLKIFYNHEKLNEIILLNPSLSKKIYFPSFFFSSGHIQTILLFIVNNLDRDYNLFSYHHKFSKTTKIVKAKDGENLYIDFFEKSSKLDENKNDLTDYNFLSKFDNSNILIILPGTCSDSSEFYIADVMQRFLSEHFKVISINHRGMLNFPLLKNRLYHTGYTDDLLDLLEFLNDNVHNSKIFLLGFSMGGNIITKLLGELGNDAMKYNIYGGSAVCAPMNLNKFVEYTEKHSYTKIYSRFFCRNLKHIFNKHLEALLQEFEDHQKEKMIHAINQSSFASEFYKNYLFVNFGFKTMEEYENTASGAFYLKNIKVPFLILFAEDDPIIPHYSIDDSGYEENDNIILAKSKSGGHVGFFKGFIFERWIYEPILDFIRDSSRLKL
jgi:predicted alpha/beta-fold hydrolase